MVAITIAGSLWATNYGTFDAGAKKSALTYTAQQPADVDSGLLRSLM